MNLRQITSSLRNGSARTRLALRVAMWGMAISVAVVTLSQLIVNGFRSTIEQKMTTIVSFAHVVENNPIFVTSDMIELDDDQLSTINAAIAPQSVEATVEGQVVAQKGANTIGLLVIGGQADSIASDAIRLSQTSARLLGAEVGDQIDITTFVDTPRRRMLKVQAIYSSGIVEMESSIAFVSLETARALSQIDSGYVSYYRIAEATPLEPLRAVVDEEGLKVTTVADRAPHVYSWLSMIDQNMTLILIIMTIVAIINVATATLIAIVDNMSKIATLRALGMRASTVRKLFIMAMSRYVVVGAVIGLVVGLSIGAVQYFTQLISLDSASYFLSAIPISFQFASLALYVLIIGAVVTLSMLLPVGIISKLSIASTIKYE